MSQEAFDVIIIGSGPGGYVCAIRAAQLGLKTACVEYEDSLGGTCLNVGCIPSKALLQSSEEFHKAAHELKLHGVMVDAPKLDLSVMQKRKDEIVKGLTRGVEGLFKKNKVTWLKGRGGFAGPGRVTVTAKDGSRSEYQTKHVVIATGSKPIEIPPAKYDRQVIISSTGALKLDRVPKHLLVVGGGVIGLEMGSVWLRLGAKVTVIEAMDRILASMDGECGKALQRSLEKQGMNFLLSRKLTASKVSKDQVEATLEGPEGSQTISGDRMLVAVGRRAYTEGLNLDAIGLKISPQGKVATDGHGRTAVANVWAIGDVTDGPMLAHKAEDEGVAVAELIAGGAGHVNYEAIPSVVYTWPEVASVGASEEQLKEQKISYTSGKFPFLANGRAKALQSTDGFVKLLADASTDRLLGAHIVGPTASELIAELALAIEFQASAEDIARTCHAHPTLSEVVREAALGVAKRAIHI